jgi:hypothetical protein
MSNLIFYISAIILIIWGTAHLIPTRNVVNGFGDISEDNKKIITMEWVVEGVSFIFIGALVATITFVSSTNEVSFYVYCLSAVVLFSLAVVSFFTGYKVKFLPFRMCPFVVSMSGVLVSLGLFVQ